MFMKKQVGLVALALGLVAMSGVVMAATSSNTLTVNAALTSACNVASGGVINMGSKNALYNAANLEGNSGSTFQVACSVDVASPIIYSTTARTLDNGTDTFVFSLSKVALGGTTLPTTQGAGAALGISQDGTLKDVTLYAQALTANFQGKSNGAYTAAILVSVDY